MADRSARNKREQQDRKDLATYREIFPDAQNLRDYMDRMKRIEVFIQTIGSRRKPYFKPEELPK